MPTETEKLLSATAQTNKDKKTATDAIEFLQQEYMLPYDADIERLVISIMVFSEKLRFEAIATFRREDFYFNAFKHVFEAIVVLTEKGDTVNAVTVGGVLRERGHLQELNGVAGLSNILDPTASVSASKDLRNYAEKLRNKSIARELFKVARDIGSSCFETSADADTLISSAEERILSLRKNSVIESSLKSYKQVADDTRTELQKWQEGISTALKTGIPELDKKLWARGVAREELYYFAALSSYGKTALVWQLLNHFETMGQRGIFFSLEMSAVKLIIRTIMRMGSGLGENENFEVSPYTVKRIDAKSEEMARIAEFNNKTYERCLQILKVVENWNGFIDDTTRNWSKMKSKIRRAANEQQLDYIAGDYVQMVQNYIPGSNRRDLEIQRISSESKELAVELKVPFIWISQLNRNNKGQRPEMQDLKESSYLEQDADFLGFIYGKGASKEKIKELQFYCAKQRNGFAGWELPFEFHSTKQLFLTEQLLTVMTRNGMVENEDYVVEPKQLPEAQLQDEDDNEISLDDIKF